MTSSVGLYDYIGERKDSLVQTMLRAYSFYFQPYVNIFDDFYAFLQQAVLFSVDTCRLREEFYRVFFNTFHAAYVASPFSGVEGSLPDTEEFRQCFYDYFFELNKEDISIYFRAFTRSFNRTMYYLRAISTAESVLKSVMNQTLTKQCKDSIMKMTHCARCSGYPPANICKSLCVNTMRGCLVHLTDLSQPFQEFVHALVRMKEYLESVHNIWNNLTLLDVDFLEIVRSTVYSAATIRDGVSV